MSFDSRLTASSLALLGLAFGQAHAADPMDQPAPFAHLDEARPAAIEASWTPLRLPTGDHIALAGLSYYVALDDNWGVGPSVYGAGKGNYGGIFTMGFSVQRRWRIGVHSHVSAGLYAGAGGGLSSSALRFGGGLMLRPELAIHNEFDHGWYSGVSWSMVRFPSGNVRGSSLGFVVGKAGNFSSFQPDDSGRPGATRSRTGFGFDEVVLFGGVLKPGSGSHDRSGNPSTGKMGTAGADLRQYIADGSWWAFEGAGAAQGGSDGYMQLLLKAGQDWAIGGESSGVRAGAELGLGLGGGGNVDTGNGWLFTAGPSLRWQTPWGPSLHLDAGLTRSFSGSFSAPFLRVGLGLPLDKLPQTIGAGEDITGTVRTQQLMASSQHLSSVKFKDGSSAPVTELAILMTRELTGSVYGTAQAGSAAIGHAGAYSFGLFGLGLQSPYRFSRMRFGAEVLVGAGGGGGVAVGGGAIGQAEGWLQWEGERLRLRAGIGQWRALRGTGQSSSMYNLSVGYAFGTLAR